MDLLRDQTNPSIEFLAIDQTGDPVTGIEAADITATYQKHLAGLPLQSAQSITLDDAEDANWGEGLLHERGNGIYRLDLPAAAVASTSGNRLVVAITHGTATIVVPEIRLGDAGLTPTDIQQIRYRLGMDGTTDEPEVDRANLGAISVSVTYTAIASANNVQAGTVSRQRATDWVIEFTESPDISGHDVLLLTVKNSISDADSAAVLQIKLSEPADSETDGLIRLNGAAADPGQRTKASLTLSETGKPTILVDPSIAALIPVRRYVYGFKTIDATGSPLPEVREPVRGDFFVTDIVTQQVSTS